MDVLCEVWYEELRYDRRVHARTLFEYVINSIIFEYVQCFDILGH